MPSPRSRSIATYLFAGLACPILALVVLLGINAWHNWTRLQQADAGTLAIALAHAGGTFIHDLQTERAASVGFVNSADRRFGEALPRLRQATDASRTAFHAAAATYRLTAEMAEMVERISRRGAELVPQRAAVDGRTQAASDIARWYTESIAHVLGFIPRLIDDTADAQSARAGAAYTALLVAKERTGQERALLVQAFSSDRMTAEQGLRWSQLRGMQMTRFDAVEGFSTPLIRDLLASVKAAEKPLEPFRAAVQAYISSSSSSAMGQDASAWYTASTAWIDALKTVEDRQIGELALLGTMARDQAHSALLRETVFALAGVLAACAIAWWTMRRLRRTVGRMTGAVESARSSRDLTVIVDGQGIQEMDRIAQAFNGLLAEMSAALTEVQARADDVRTTTNRLTGAATSVESAMATSDASAHGAGTAAHGIAEHLQAVASASQELAATTREIATSTTRTTDLMQQSASLMSDLDGSVSTLTESSRSIGDILQVITGIAEQTNLLALNATIEAARAGDAGRGFAVVASEVKGLAQQSATAAHDIERRIQDVQRAIQHATQVTVRLSEALRSAEQAQQSIAAAMEEQNATSDELARTVQGAAERGTQVDKAVADVVAASQQAKQAVQASREATNRLMEVASGVTTVANRFRTGSVQSPPAR